MLKSSKKPLLMGIALSLTMATSAFAATTPTNYNVVSGGMHLGVSQDVPAAGDAANSVITNEAFSTTSQVNPFTINMGGNMAEQTIFDYLHVVDNTGTNAGWQLNVTVSPIVGTFTDPTGVAEDKVSVTIPAGAIIRTATASDITALNNSVITNVDMQPQIVSNSVITDQTQTIVNAQNGYGAGDYYVKETFTIGMPNYLPANTTVTTTNDGSKFKSRDPQTIGTFAGQYTTTINYSITFPHP